MQNIESLSDLFDLVGCRVSYYDVGRHISKITPQQAIQFDRKQQPYPYGFRKHAWLACVLSQKELVQEPVIWFLRLPLDETGCLNLGTRDHFIKTIVDKIMHKGSEQGLNEALEDNPYAFQPDQERLASLHAVLGQDLKQQPSSFYTPFLAYADSDGLCDASKWSELGYQGIADFATRLNDTGNLERALRLLNEGPKEVVFPLCHALEHDVQGEEIVSLICQKLTESNTTPMDAAHWIRAISRNDFPGPLFIPLFTLLGDIAHCTDEQLELIASLVSKCPHWVTAQPQLLRIILEKLAHREDGLLGFKHIVTDLTQQPDTREQCWEILRSQHASKALQQAVGGLFNQGSATLQ